MEKNRRLDFRFGALSIRARILASALVTVGLIVVLDVSTLRSVSTVEAITGTVRADTGISGTVQETAEAFDGLGQAVMRYALLQSEAALQQLQTQGTALDGAAARLQDATRGTSLAQAVDALLANKEAFAEGGHAVAGGVGQRRAATDELNRTITEMRTVQSALQGFLLRENQADLLQIATRLGDSQQTGTGAALRYLGSRNPADSGSALAEVATARKLIGEAMAAGQPVPRVQRLGKAYDTALSAYEGALKGAVQATDRVDVALRDMTALSGRIAGAKQALANDAAAELTGSLDTMTEQVVTTRNVSLGVSGLAILLGFGMTWLVSRSIGRQIGTISSVMDRLAADDLAVEVPMVGRRDEIGAMARAVGVFKKNAWEKIRLESQQAELARRAGEEKRRSMAQLADSFEQTVGGLIQAVARETEGMQTRVREMTRAVGETDQLANSVAAATEQTSANVQTVASATEELSGSIGEISRQVGQSAEIAREASAIAGRANGKVEGLAQAVERIGAVVELINSIASQTNLLALNATIEAARAGEAGKGFAVVASEVKALANQTAKATEDIASQVAGIQAVTGEAVSEIKDVGRVIGRVNEVAGSIASAVEQQGAATREISRNIQQAAHGTKDVATGIGGVNQAASSSGKAAHEVLDAIRQLSSQTDTLNGEVGRFLARVRTA